MRIWWMRNLKHTKTTMMSIWDWNLVHHFTTNQFRFIHSFKVKNKIRRIILRERHSQHHPAVAFSPYNTLVTDIPATAFTHQLRHHLSTAILTLLHHLAIPRIIPPGLYRIIVHLSLRPRDEGKYLSEHKSRGKKCTLAGCCCYRRCSVSATPETINRRERER